MTREEAIQFLDNIKHAEAGRAIGKDGFYAELIGYHIEALNMAIKALEHPERNVVAVVPCGDTISRQAVLDIINFEDKWLLDAKGHNADTEIAFSGMKSKVSAIPPVNPQEPKTGHWILDETDNSITCDKCGCLIWANDISNGEAYYCPNCGAKMVEPQESEDKE